jgi:4-amino-4-deoxy-L-arabinose transferase-like glycosyltransferase
MAIDLAHARRLILSAAVAGLVVRLAFALLYWVDKPLTHDEREYLALAQSIAAGRGFAYDTSHETGTAQQFGRAPGYPFFLAFIGAGSLDHDASHRRVKIAQAIVGAFGVWVVGLIALRGAGPRAGVTAAAIAAVYPPLVWICAYVLSEAFYSAVALLTVLLLDLAIDRADEARRRRAGLALTVSAGVAAGVAILVRPTMLFFLPLAALWLVTRRRGTLAAVLTATALIVVTPWTVRNFQVHDRFVLVASEGGVTFWTGNHPLARGEGDLAANPEIKRAEIAFRNAHPGLTAEQLEPLFYRDALRYIAAHPGWWLMLVAKKAFYTLVPIGPSYTLHSTRYLVASVASYLLLLPFAVAGMRRWVHSRPRPETLFLLAASAVIAGLVFFPQERFRIPVIDPTLIVCAGIACADRLKPS